MDEANKIRVIMVEDDPDWLRIMADYLGKCGDIVLVGTASDRQEALQCIHEVPADVVLMDINLTENKRDGIAVALEIVGQIPIKVIMLTSLGEEQLITDSFAAGAVDYVSKDDYREIPAHIRQAVQQRSPLEVLLKDYVRLKREEQLKELTPAEREVFDLFEKGYTLTQIEEKMYKTHNTLRSQVKKILAKLRVKNRAEALKKVDSKGIYGKYDMENEEP